MPVRIIYFPQTTSTPLAADYFPVLDILCKTSALHLHIIFRDLSPCLLFARINRPLFPRSFAPISFLNCAEPEAYSCARAYLFRMAVPFISRAVFGQMAAQAVPSAPACLFEITVWHARLAERPSRSMCFSGPAREPRGCQAPFAFDKNQARKWRWRGQSASL